MNEAMQLLKPTQKTEVIGDTTYYWNLVQGSDEWLQARLGILTASQTKELVTATGKIAANDKTRAIVYQKVAERLTGRIEESYSNAHMERGHTYEPFARDLYAETQAPVRECGFIVRQFDGFKIGYSPDGLVGENGLIEIKAPARAKHVKEICEAKEPSEYMLQMQTGLLVTGCEWIDYVAHFNGMHQRIVRIEPDLELHEKIKDAAKILEEQIRSNIINYHLHTQDMPQADFIEAE